jgi:hypothetical protein
VVRPLIWLVEMAGAVRLLEDSWEPTAQRRQTQRRCTTADSRRSWCAVVWADTSEGGAPQKEDGLATSKAVSPAHSVGSLQRAHCGHDCRASVSERARRDPSSAHLLAYLQGGRVRPVGAAALKCCGRAAKYSNHSDRSRPSTALNGRLTSPPDLSNSPAESPGRRGRARNRARSGGEPRGMAGTRSSATQVPQSLRCRSAQQSPAVDPSFPS